MKDKTVFTDNFLLRITYITQLRFININLVKTSKKTLVKQGYSFQLF